MNDQYVPGSGRQLRSDNTIVNSADGVNDDGSRNVKVTGGNIALPVDIQGISLVNPGEALPVTIAGQNSAVEVLTLVDNLALRSVALQIVNMPDLSKYVRYDIYVISSLDQVVRIAPWKHTAIVLVDETIGRWSVDLDGNDGLSYSFRIPAKPAIGTGSYWLSEILPTSSNSGTIAPKVVDFFRRVNNSGGTPLTINYRTPVAAPISGTITIRLVGYLQ